MNLNLRQIINHLVKSIFFISMLFSSVNIATAFVYEHDKVGNRVTMQLSNGDTATYGYDAIYQLTSEQRTGVTSYNISWTYDEVGNRLTQVRDIKKGIGKKKGKGKPDFRGLPGKSTIDYIYNDANQLLEERITRKKKMQVNKYTYDPNGNQTQIIKNFGRPKQKVYNWGYDYENRQISYDDPVDTNDATYTYDATGKRISKTTNELQTTNYLYDGANIIADYDTWNNLKASYVTPFLDQNLLATLTLNLEPETFYYMQDGLGSVRNLLDAQCSTLNSYDYYAFGGILSETETIPNRYKFTAREWDSESKTYYYRARQYDPFIGRFLRRDPMPEGQATFSTDLYTYVQNNPVNMIDPMGRERQPPPPSPKPKPPTPPKKCPICGPDVTDQVKAVVAKIKTTFATWTAKQKNDACYGLTSFKGDPAHGGAPAYKNAWDIEELTVYDTLELWVNAPPYCPPCTTQPECRNSVEVNGRCFYGGSVNYVAFGTMWRLCRGHTGRTKRFSEYRMLQLIDLWKGPILIFREAAPNWIPSREWAKAGYRGWPAVFTPASTIKPQCKPTCPKPYIGAPFTIYWYPHGNF